MNISVKKIKKIKISYESVNPDTGVSDDFILRINPDENNESVKFSLTDIDARDDDRTVGRKYYVKINGSSTKKDFPTPPISEGDDDLYNMSILVSEFTEDDNVVQFYYDTTAVGNETFNNPVGDIKFFGEVEASALGVRLEAPGLESTTDQAFWDYIKSARLDFNGYKNFLNGLMCGDVDFKYKRYGNTQKDDTYLESFDRSRARINSTFIGTDSYNVIKFATEAYMLKVSGIDKSKLGMYLKGNNNSLPYYDRVIQAVEDYFDNEICASPLYNVDPFMIELIWNFWMEQGMLVETMKLISMRFRNFRGNRRVDLLQRFDTDPLRPLSHILWGYTQDIQHQLLSEQRAHEYLHEYGLLTLGENLGRIDPVDSRSKFLEGFHNLLNCCSIYFKEVDDMTRKADAFPILNSLKEVHLLLAEGNHNAYGNLTWTARHEMMIQQYILSRSEMREFMGGKVMVPYNELWMDRVDTVRNIQQWGSTSITYFYELAVYGEQILLSVRLGDWSDVTLTSNNAANWALAFRDSIQRYIHALRVATGIDLSVDHIQSVKNIAVQPALLIQDRARPYALPKQQQRGYIPLNRY